MFDFPSAPDLYRRALGAFRSIGGFDAATPRNNVSETAKVLAGAQEEDYGRLDYVGRQAFVGTAEGQWLEKHAAQYEIARRPATTAAGAIVVSASAPISIAAGAQFQRGDGWVYATTETALLPAGGSVSMQAVAVSNAPINAAGAVDGSGPSGNCDLDTPLSVLSGVTGAGASLATAAVAPGGMVGGAASEVDGDPWTTDLGTLRGRLLWRLRNPPHGGAPSDYVLWASSVPGVTRVFVERRWRGPGTVRVFPLFDNLFPGGIPDAARLASVQAAIESVAPAACVVTVAAATPRAIDVAVQGLQPNTAAEQAAVRTELAAAFLRLSRVAGVDYAVPGMDYLCAPFSFAQIWIAQAVASAANEKRAVLLAPLADIVIPAGSIPVLGNVSFS